MFAVLSAIKNSVGTVLHTEKLLLFNLALHIGTSVWSQYQRESRRISARMWMCVCACKFIHREASNSQVISAVMWSETVGVLGTSLLWRSRPVWDQKIGLGLGLACLMLCCETRPCHARRHNDLEGHSNFSSTIYSFSILCLEHHCCGDRAIHLLKSWIRHCLCLLPVVMVLLFWSWS